MKRVLIFDDDADILELCSLVLQDRGFLTFGETTCKNLIDSIKKSDPDVILMDNWIPDIGGVKATQLIKKTTETRHIPVIFFSASNEARKFSDEAHADFFLQKPFDINELETVIRNAIKEKD